MIGFLCPCSHPLLKRTPKRFANQVSFEEDASSHVLHRADLQRTGQDAVAAYHDYLDGKILSRSLKEFIQNFRNVYGLREYDDELA